MILKKMKNRMLSILLTAAVAVTAVPSVPVMAMPEGGEEAYISEDRLTSDSEGQVDSEDMLPETDAEQPEEEQQEGNSEGVPEAELPVTDDTAEGEISQFVDEDSAIQPEVPQDSEEYEYSGALNVDVKAVGTNGYIYDDVAYLSVKAYNSLPEDAQKVYVEMCDAIAEWKESGQDVHNIVLSVDENGELMFGASMSANSLYTADAQQLIDGMTEESAGESGDTKEDSKEEIKDDTKETTNTEKTEDIDGVESGDIDTGNTDGDKAADNSDAADKEETDKNDGIEGKEETDSSTDTKDNDETDGTNDSTVDSEDTDGSSDTEDNKKPDDSSDVSDDKAVAEPQPSDSETGDVPTDEETGEAQEPSNMETEAEGIISENVELAAAYGVDSQCTGELSVAELDTLLTNNNYFKNQLDSFTKMFYDTGKKFIVDQKLYNEKLSTPEVYVGFTLKTSAYVTEKNFPLACVNSISALVNMYPNSFNWVNLGSENALRIEGSYMNGRGSYTVALLRSKYYNTTLESQATAQINSLVDAAVNYALATYPTNPTYGIIDYFDNWICEHNYYNMIGTHTDAASMASEAYYYCHNVYGILLKGYGVCESYALAMSSLLDAAGIRNQYIMGDAGGGHAWDYVQMPDNQWYMLDSTWNDDEKLGTSTKDYFLVCDDGIHKATGMRFQSGKSFKFEKLSKANAAEPDKTTLMLKPKAKYNMSVQDSFYSKMVSEWSSDDKAIASVDKNGVITAGKKAGKTKINMKLNNGKTYSVDVTVYQYQVASLTFPYNNKSAYTDTYADDDNFSYYGDSYYIYIDVNQKDKILSAENLQKAAQLPITVTSGNTKVAEVVGNPIFEGDRIRLDIFPKAIGKSKITVKFAGKTASYTLNVKYGLQENWFKCESDAAGYAYTGKPYKPKVTKDGTGDLAKNAKYKVTYVNNKNAGTATVRITGTGNYAGIVEKYFTINPVNLEGEVQFLSCTESMVYNGAGQQPKTKVKVGSKTLKAGSDYVLLYNGSEELPTEVGTYTVTIKGNNYKISSSATKEFEIKKTNLDKVKVTCPSSMKATGNDLVPAVREKIVVKIGKNILDENVDYSVTFCDNDGKALTQQKITEAGTYKVVFAPIGKNVEKSAKKESIVKTLKVK